MQKKIKRICFISLITFILMGAVLLVAWIFVKNQKIVGDERSAATAANFFNGEELKAFTDLSPEFLLRREKIFSIMDLRNKFDTLTTCSFSTKTKWPPIEKLPPGFIPSAIIEEGKDPGLGIRELNRRGITGKGVHVAIHDFPLFREHIEYKDRLFKIYPDYGKDPAGNKKSRHGTAVASIFLGKNCGIAPEVLLHFWVNNENEYSYRSAIKAVEDVLTANRNHPGTDRIRVFSISIGLDMRIGHYQEWVDTLKKAKENGLILVHCGINMMGVGCPLGKNRNDPRNYRICYFASGAEDHMPADTIYLPIDNRTMADVSGVDNYYFAASGGLSLGAPYLAGIMALGLQINPDLNEDDLYRFLRETGTPFNGGRLVNPPDFIQKIREKKKI